MKFTVAVVLFGLIAIFSSSTRTLGQPSVTAAQSAENLRAQLEEVRAKEADLNARAQQLDEQLKPENIERSLAGVGSTHPEELREMRRRQLSSEKASVTHQLDQLAVRRARLETALQSAENEAYQESALGPATPLNRFGLAGFIGSSRLLVAALVGCLAFAAIVVVTVVMRRQG